MTDVFSHPWLGGLFNDPATQMIWSPDHQIAHMLAFEAALTRALASTGKAPIEVAEKIAEKIQAFTPDMKGLRAGTGRDGVVVPALVRQLKSLAGDYPEVVHSGATSQDVIDTALVLTLRDNSLQLHQSLTDVQAGIQSLVIKFGTNEMMGRTRNQAAIPIHVVDRLTSWSAPLERHSIRLTNLRKTSEVLQLGGAVGTNVAFGQEMETIVQSVANQLDLSVASQVWHTTRDKLTDYANLLSMITGSLGKMGQDICLMSQQGIDTIRINGGGSSSAMPNKQNPVLAELLVSLARFNATQVTGMHQAIVHEQERSGAAWSLEWMILPQMA
ncbi:MAG: 3-carboxy-cis,cis-muconate cycloisomerase, partial [Boseongicola sp.]|nr:3-carboxy-cis,cis-muconate cycloisomerase [Boseongicola sp.]